MCKLLEIGRVLHEHNWHVPMEWARMLEELGNLSDNEIEQLVNEKNRLPPTPDPDGYFGHRHITRSIRSAAGG